MENTLQLVVEQSGFEKCVEALNAASEKLDDIKQKIDRLHLQLWVVIQYQEIPGCYYSIFGIYESERAAAEACMADAALAYFKTPFKLNVGVGLEPKTIDVKRPATGEESVDGVWVGAY